MIDRLMSGSGSRLSLRWAQLIAGLFLYGVAAPLMIRSGLGLGPWDAFHVGISLLSGMSVGLASILVGAVIVVSLMALGLRPGPGTLANMVLIGVFIDLILPIMPAADGFAMGLAYFAGGIGLVGLSTGMYIGPQLGAGPRDGLLIGLSRRTGRSIRLVRTLIEVTVLFGGWLMGATVGVGTVLFALLIGPSTQFGLQLFNAVPAPPEPDPLTVGEPPATRRVA